MDKKNIAIIFLFLIIFVLGYFLFKKDPLLNQDFIQRQQELLDRENDSLLKELYLQKEINSKIKVENDSLQSLKSKVKIIYKNKYNEIDKSYSAAISSEFDSVFAASNIK